MPSPFPGMDPYLESPEIFPDVHARLIVKIQDALNPKLRPNYMARVEMRVYVEEDDLEHERVPDVRIEKSKRKRTEPQASNGNLLIAEPVLLPSLPVDPIEETYLTIRRRESKALVAVLEVISPSNKVHGSEGRTSFLDKRREVLSSAVHWIEIDLLRKGSRLLPRFTHSTDYRVIVVRGDKGRVTKGWPISLRQPLPVVGIPLRGSDPDVPLDLAEVFNSVYDLGSYDLAVDYDQPPDPPLNPDDSKWANKLLRAKGLR